MLKAWHKIICIDFKMSCRLLEVKRRWLEVEPYMMQVKENPHPCFSPQFNFCREAFVRVKQNKKFGGWQPYATTSNILMLNNNSNLSYKHIKIIGCASLVMLIRLHGSTFCHQNDLQ